MTAAEPAHGREMPFRRKLSLTILLAGLVPLIAASVVTFLLSRASLERSAERSQLIVRDSRKRAVAAYFETAASNVRLIAGAAGTREQFSALAEAWGRLPEDAGWASPAGAEADAESARRKDEALRALSVFHAESRPASLPASAPSTMPTDLAAQAAQTLFIVRNPHPVGSKHLLDRPSGVASAYGAVHSRLHGFVTSFLREYGFDDLYLVDARTGNVVYSWTKGLDFGASVRDGALATTGLARTSRRAMEVASAGDVVAEDFEFYAPAGGRAASFLGCSVRGDGAVLGALVVRLPLDPINQMLAPRVDASASAETFLVGADRVARSQLRFFDRPTALREHIDSVAVSRALAGESAATLANDYRGVPSVVAYAPLEVLGMKYGIVRKIDESEAFASVRELMWWMAGLGVVLVVLSSVAAVVLGRSLARPVSQVTERLQAMAQSLLSTAQEQQAGAAEAAAAVEETRQTFAGVLGAAQNLRKVGTEVLSSAEVSQRNAQTIGRRIHELSESTVRIGEILALVKEIANRSDLLALNAALEGTKAGEAGRGFSLVATQMQRLAEEVMGSVKKIEGLTQDITRSSAGAVLAAEEADKVAAHTTESAQHIAEAVQTQQGATEQVSVAMNEIATVARGSVDASRTIVESANHLLGVAQDLRRILGTKG